MLSIILIIGLGLIILVGFWFLHIILLTYFLLKHIQKNYYYDPKIISNTEKFI